MGAWIWVLTAAFGAPLVHDVSVSTSTGSPSGFGEVIRAVDVDGDGSHELIVGDPLAASANGAAYLYPGSPTGLNTGGEVAITQSTPALNDQFGVSVAGGDIDGDGYDDLLVGCTNCELATLVNAGVVRVFLGSATGIDPSGGTILSPSDAASSQNFGHALSGAGDIDGDGYDDVVVGGGGAVYVYRGSATGLTGEQKLTATTSLFGTVVARAGDVNGDGYDDIVVGAPFDNHAGSDSGAAFVYLGSATGIDPASERRLVASDAAASSQFGVAVASAGDVDGDGYDDVLIGANYDSNEDGAAYLFKGSATGVDPNSGVKFTDGVQYSNFGHAVAGAGDLDGDGYDDVLVGAPLSNDLGAVLAYFGSATGLDTANPVSVAHPSATADAEFGRWVAAGDIDGNGTIEVAVGAPEDGTGSVHLFCVERDWYADTDGDGFGDPNATHTACRAPSGHVGVDTDCDDGDTNAFPGATDTPDDGVDQDCDGTDATAPADTDTDTDTDTDLDTDTPPGADDPARDKEDASCGCAQGRLLPGLSPLLLTMLALRRRQDGTP